MLDRIVPAGLQDVQEAYEIALEVGVRVGDGVADACLRREVDDCVETLRGEERVQRLLVRDVHLDEALALPGAELGDAPVLEPDIIVVVEVVDADHLVPAFREHIHQFRADESCGSRDQYFHFENSLMRCSSDRRQTSSEPSFSATM